MRDRLRDRLRSFSLTPFEQQTPEGRAKERHRRVALTAAAAALAKLLSVTAALISIPLTLQYLGVERFGMWMTISSLIAMLAFADFGIANGVLSAVADAHGRDDGAAIQRFVSSGFFMLSGIALVLIGGFAAVYAHVPWHAVFNVQTELARTESGPALAVFGVCFALAIPLAVVQRVQMGLQQGFTASLWQCVGSVFALSGVIVAIELQAGLPWLVLALAGAPLLAAAGNSLHFYCYARPELRPRWCWATAEAARRVAAIGGLFFVLQLTVALAFTSDSIVIAQLLGASAVAQYAVPEKLFGLITLALAMVLAPLWPAYGEALARGDSAWVRYTLRNSILTAVGIAASVSVALVILAPAILHLWVGIAVVPQLVLLIALAVWKVVESVGIASAMFLNGARVVRFQVLCAVPTALCAVFLKVTLVPQIGVSGVVWGTLIAYVGLTLLPLAFKAPSLLRAIDRKAQVTAMPTPPVRFEKYGSF